MDYNYNNINNKYGDSTDTSSNTNNNDINNSIFGCMSCFILVIFILLFFMLLYVNGIAQSLLTDINDNSDDIATNKQNIQRNAVAIRILENGGLPVVPNK